MGLLLFYLVLALLVSFICSVMEAVILSVPMTFVNLKASEGGRSALLLKKMKQNLDRPLSAILSLNTIAHTVGAAGVGAQAAIVFGEAYLGITSAILTILILMLSEIIPKTIGSSYWRQLSLITANITQVMIWICYPLVILSEQLTRLISSNNTEATVSREEVSAMVNIGAEEGVFQDEETKAIQNVITLKTIRAREVMTPRIVVTTASEDMSCREFFEQKENFQHSRIPVYHGESENITGYVRKQKVFEKLAEGRNDLKLGEIKREILIASDNQYLSILWEKMQSQKEQIVLIVDEYGSFEGLVTTEDVVEFMLGLEIVDEKDTVEDMQEYAKQKWEERKAKYGQI